MIYIIISKGRNGCGAYIEIKADAEGAPVFNGLPRRVFYGYNEREALRIFRRENGLTGKHLDIIRV